MGVKTKAWGPHAWKFIHGLCKSIDDGLTHTNNSHLLEDAINIFRELYLVLPCIYCRHSLRQFLDERRTNVRLVGEKNAPSSFSEWIYLIHERVNKKLFWQDAKTQPDKLFGKWLGYQPDMGSVDYVFPDTPEWWFHMFTFTSYVFCDYPSKKEHMRRKVVRTFMNSLSVILCKLNIPSGFQFKFAIQRTALPKDFDTSLQSRIGYVVDIQNTMRLSGGVLCPSADEISSVCEYAMVGCDPFDKKRVGC